MSSLPHTNGEAAREWIELALWRYDIGIEVLKKRGDTKEAVRNFSSATETALKAVYIKHETIYPRTHEIGELIQGCPDPTVQEVTAGYSEEFVKYFSKNYLAPYVQAKPIALERVEECRKFAERIIKWAEGIIKTGP